MGGALDYLEQFPRWINWALVPDPLRPEKPKKLPISPLTGQTIAANDPKHHVTYAQALATGRPVGFVFTQGDSLWFLDIDNCLMPDGTWSTVARHLVDSLPGSAWEVSQSGKGLHGFGYAATIPEHGCRNIPLGLELYHADRFCAVTHQGTSGGITQDTTAALANVVAEFFQRSAQSSDVVGWTDGPQDGGGITADDDELIAIMLRSGQKTAAAFFSDLNVTFADLWFADADKLAAKWPSSTGPYDASQADSALASHLAYWTAKDAERTQQLMLRSELKREKWEREDYLPRTILRAFGTVRNVAKPRDVPAPLGGVSPALVATVNIDGTVTATPALGVEPATVSPGPPQTAMIRGLSFMSPGEQQQFFTGCVYVSDLLRVWVPTDGTLQDKARFDITYGGSNFSVQADQRSPEKSAWTAYTQNHSYAPRIAHNICFRPEMPSGAITFDGLVNTYIPVETPKARGDVSKFTAHLAKLFPVPDDLAIVVTWMAATVRNPGAKHQWGLVVQGGRGNGKSLLHRVLAFSIGSKYTHLARASAMAKTGNQFNDWVVGKLYVCMEEISVGDKREFLEEIKDLMTNTEISTEGKGLKQGTSDNRANILMLTNKRDGVPMEREERRYAVFYNPQQSKADLVKWGMEGTYFPDIYDWLKGRGAYADLGADFGLKAVNYWLHHEAAIDVRFDPTGACQWAPDTSSTDEALGESLGGIEQEVLENVRAGAQGFADGWISEYHLGQLLERMRMGRMSHTKRRDMLRTLGYITHPGLPDGRVPVALEGIGHRPVLHIRAGHLSCQLTSPAAVQAAYEAAQKNALTRNAGPATGVGDVVKFR